MKQFAWFVTGAAMGGALAMLYAPQKGSDTRKVIREKSEKGFKVAAEKSKQVTEQGRAALHRGVAMADNAKEVVVRKVKAVAA
jgi:gas vesicle protein